MIFNVKCIKIAVFLLCFVHGEDAAKQSKLSSTRDSEKDTKSKYTHKYQREKDVAEESEASLKDESVGEKSKLNSKIKPDGDSSDKRKRVDNDNEFVEGDINIPNEFEGDGEESTDGSDDAISGSIEISDDSGIEGTINLDDGQQAGNGNEYQDGDDNKNSNCWLNLNSNHYLDSLDEIDAKYEKARQLYEDKISPNFDKKMMEVLMSSQGKAPRAIHQAHGNPNIIPAGLNLGGFGMMRMPGSMLFFHRMKLRNSTMFTVNHIHASLADMTLVARLSLNDLHLRGAYERAITQDDESVLYFRPTYGELDVLIKSVNYKVDGRLRMLNNRLMVELINSDLVPKGILLTYANSTESAKNFAFESVEDFIGRIKTDLDIWLKDYFNDYLMYYGIVGSDKNSVIQLYEKQKTIKANEFADHALQGIKRKLRDSKSANVKLPTLTLLTMTNKKIKLKNGILRGLDSIYRRSVAMTKKDKDIRTLDMTTGFSNLKVEYQYEAMVLRGMPPLSGLLILTADELSNHLAISQVDGTQTVDINVDSIVQLKPESLTVEGPANRLIANFKYILENPIVSIMTNVMKHNIKMLKTITRCQPNLWGVKKEHNSYGENNKESETKNNNDNAEDADNKWSDYTFSKNDNVKVEIPVNGYKK